MIAGQADDAALPHGLDALARLGPIAHDIAGTEQHVAVFLVQVLEDRLQGIEIAVYVAEDSVFHAREAPQGVGATPGTKGDRL